MTPVRELSSAKAASRDGHADRANSSVMAIIPAFNEEDTLAAVIDGATPYVDEVIVIDDASGDATNQIARSHADGVISHPKNLGIGASLETGYQFAIEEDYDILVQLDGDGQHDPSHIPQLVHTLETTTAGMVIGSRWLNSSHEEYAFIRRIGVPTVTSIANVLGGLDLTDVTSGYRAFDVSLLETLGPLDKNHWALEQTLEASRCEFSIEEVSIPMPPNGGDSQFDAQTYTMYPLRMVLATLKVLLFR